MAVIVTPKTTPQALLDEIRAKMGTDEIDTWVLDSDGDFTHSPPQWNKKAWLRPLIKDGNLVFRIFPPKATNISSTVYAVYHGRFIEMLLQHFDDSFTEAKASAMPCNGDRVRSSVT
jgi:hypothetical protein